MYIIYMLYIINIFLNILKAETKQILGLKSQVAFNVYYTFFLDKDKIYIKMEAPESEKIRLLGWSDTTHLVRWYTKSDIQNIC